MTVAPLPDTLTYLDRASVHRLMPSVQEQMDRIAQTYVAMAAGRVENPPKIGVHPRAGAFLHAMPAHLADQDVTALKWVAAYPGNAARALPSVSGLIVLNDSDTGLPLVVMDGSEITAARTAAASGVGIRHLAHPGWRRVAILGYGEQGRRHAEVIRAMRPDAEIRVYGGPRLREPQEGVRLLPDARSAVEGADVVVTAGPMPAQRQPVLRRDWLADRVLVVPVDFDAYVTTELAQDADDLVVDDVAQFEHYRSLGSFEGWPSPGRSLGQALQEPARGEVRLSCSLGVGAVDAAVAALVWERARREQVGVSLPR